MSDFATFEDVTTLTGKAYGEAERERIAALLPLVSDALRFEAQKVGKDLDAMADGSASYTNVVKLVTVDIVARVLRQSQNGEPLTQESQSALGYTWSGTYAIPGGGIAGAIMKNDLKRLGLRRQQYGVMYLWDESQDAE
jgi:hypothetical protein